MNFGGRDSRADEFQLAPMLDIVFILLIFFVTTYVATEEERLLSIRLPEAQAAQDEARSPEETIVNLTEKGEIFVQSKELSPERLEQVLRRLKQFSRGEPGVIIRAHANCQHKYVVRIMDICAKTEIRRVFFSTVPMEEIGHGQ